MTLRKTLFAVAQLKLAGGIPIGKTNLDQFATGLVGIRSPYPAPKTPLTPSLYPGGRQLDQQFAWRMGLSHSRWGLTQQGQVVCQQR